MSARRGTGRCQNCGAAAHGKFCSSCGARLGGEPAVSGEARSPLPVQLTVVGAILVALVVVVLITQRVADGPTPTPAAAEGVGAAVPDISQLSPAERASRLYNRVMAYAERGSADSARFFAPMAIQAYEMLGVADAHSRYDTGMIHIVTGDSAAARAAADTILRERPTHLLGPTLAMRSARDATARAGFARRLLAANAAESANPLPEYIDHRTDVENALTDAGRFAR